MTRVDRPGPAMIPAHEVRELLGAIAGLLDVPPAARYEDLGRPERVTRDRALALTGAFRWISQDTGAIVVGTELKMLARIAADYPVFYEPATG